MSIDPTSNGQSPPASPVGTSAVSHTNQDDPLAENDPPSPADSVAPAAKPSDSPTVPIAFTGAVLGQSPGDSPNTLYPSEKGTGSSPQPEEIPQSQSLGLGALIYNAFGGSGPLNGKIPDNTNIMTFPPSGVHQAATAGNLILSMDPSGVDLDGIRYSAGGQAMTLSNNVYTFVPHADSNGDAASDGSGDWIDNSPSAAAAVQPVFTVGTQTFTAVPGGFILMGTKKFSRWAYKND